jgi:Protein of unknown function (DUF1592)/Protein of unknown function (DUF1588)/Protein of unknown function (DUF1595)/Protein of unknown function (DUF1585)/Protein of unknown function (DUF1587)
MQWKDTAMPRAAQLTRAVALALSVIGCTGKIGEPEADLPRRGGGNGAHPGTGTGGSTSTPGASATTALGRLRLLTRAQLESTLRDLLGDFAELGDTQEDSTRDGFASIGATYDAISVRGVEQFEDALLPLLRTVFEDAARRSKLIGCMPTGLDDASCVGQFIQDFGRRAWRRTLTQAEQDLHVKLALSAAQALGDIYQGLMHATSALLESPHFLYRVELGAPDTEGTYWYSGWEMGSRLSYLLWNTTPDAALLDAAEAGKLDTADGVRAEAKRLLASPRARTGIARFGREFVDLEGLSEIPKDDPRMTPTLRAAMAAEVDQLFGRWLDAGADAMDLYDSTKTFANAELAKLYGLPGTAAMGSDLVPVTLPADGLRAGLLGTGAVLSVYSGQARTSPTQRGVFVREKILCQEMPSPPPNVNTTLPTDPNLTARQKLEMHRQPGCIECHKLTDPIGFGFEVFDWIGAKRDKIGTEPIDPSGNLDDYQFKNVRELATHLKEMPEVQSCVLQNLFRYSAGHLEGDSDGSTLAAWRDLFAKSNREMATFLVDTTASDGFRTVAVTPP